MSDDRQQQLTTLTVNLLSAFVSNNNVRSEDLPALISATHQALSGLTATEDVAVQPAPIDRAGAISVRKSLANPDVILSMIDGKAYKSLKRHLTARGFTPESYRERYNLPASYPLVAPGYSEERRAVAKRLGLGRKPSTASGAASVTTPSPAAPGKPLKRSYNRRPRDPGMDGK